MLTPKKWKSKINASLKLMDQRKDEAERFLRAYTGDYNERPRAKLDANKDDMSVNFIFSFVETIGPTVYSGDPRMFLKARNKVSEESAPYLQALTNYYLKKLGVRDHLMLCRFDSFFGPCAFQSEWQFEEEEVEQDVPVNNPLTGSQMVNPFTQRPVTVRKKIWVPVKDQPLLKRISPWNAIVDPDAENRLEDRWRAIRMIVTKEEFDAMEGVTAKAKKKVKGGSIPRELKRQPYQNGDGEESHDDNYVTLFKIYDKAAGKVLILPDCQDDEDVDYVEEKDWPWEMDIDGDEWPLTILEAKHDPQNPYSMSEFKAYWQQIQERNRLRIMIQSHTRRLVMGWLMKVGAMNDEQKAKFVEAKIGELCEADNPDNVHARPNPQLPPEFFAFDSMSEKDAVNVSGFNEYNYESTADTATEASIINGRSNIRKGERKENFSRFAGKIGGKCAQLIQQYLPEEKAVQIRNPQNKQEMIWAQATPENIRGEFDYEMKPGVTQFGDEGLFRQQVLKFAELMANNPHVSQRRLAEIIAQCFDLEVDDILRSEQEVAQEQQAQAQAGQPEKEPDIQFDKIKIELLPPEIQAMIVQAGLQQNEVKTDGSMEGEMQGGAEGAMPSPPLDAAPPQESVLPGDGVNQAPPPMEGAGMPPATPIQPISEDQGGMT